MAVVKSSQGWEPALRTPHPCDHLIQLYTDEAFLTSAVSHFLRSGLVNGEAAVVIARPSHLEMFTARLSVGFDVPDAVARGQFVTLDAESCMAKFMVDGKPDRAAFFAMVNRVLADVRKAGYERIRLFGEMVDMLWERNLVATVELEDLWNEVLTDDRLCLLCSYRIDTFDRSVHRGLLHQISRSHSHSIPAEDYERLDEAVDRAYQDVFGQAGDPTKLRDLFVAHNPPPTVMPKGQAALHALRGLEGGLADEVLDRAAKYYRAPRDSSRRR
jgi:hypothetical protein